MKASGMKIFQYRPEIDGLRAFAVSSVIINHFNKDLLPSGYLGVDIFFVISGFLISSQILNQISNNQFTISSFYTTSFFALLSPHYVGSISQSGQTTRTPSS